MPGDMAWSNSQEDIANYYNLYLNMMNFWQKKFQTFIYNVKYEDLVKDPEKEFIKIISYLNKICKIKFNRERIIKSIRATNFENLQKLEDKNSFDENPKETKDQKFFRKGTANQWQKLLSKDLINKIQNEFSQTMKENGYEF